jgi:hypothetical protein
VTGLLVPLVLAAVLSVVAVRAARSGAPPRVRRPARGLAAAGIAAATAAGLLALAGQGAAHGGGPARPSSAAASGSRAAP